MTIKDLDKITPEKISLLTEFRNQNIKSEFDGNNANELAHKYKLTPAEIEQISNS